MRRNRCLYCVFAASMAFCLPGRAAEVPQPASAATAPATNVSNTDEVALRLEMATIVEDSVIPQRFDQLMNQFSRLDRDLTRAQPATRAVSLQKLDGAIADFQKAWKEKYHRDFNLRGSEAKVFNKQFVTIDVGDFGDSPRIAGDRISPPSTRSVSSLTGTTGINTRPPHNPASAPATQPYAVNNRAIAAIHDSQAATSQVVSFVQEGAVWKLDAPGQVDPQRMQEALVAQLQALTKDAGKWPEDQGEAYRIITCRVFAAIGEATNVPVDLSSRITP